MKPKDTAEKLLEDYNDVFADIINTLLFGGKRVIEESALEPAGEISQYKIGKKFHGQERDVMKYWVKASSGIKGKIMLSSFGIENETEICRVMPVRVVGYDGAAYRDQLNKDADGESDGNIYPVVTVVLYFGTKEHWTEKYRSLHGVMDIPEELVDYVSDYHINVFEIAWLDDEMVAKFQSDFRIVADYFVQMRKNKDYIASDDQMKHVNEVLNLMSVLTGDQRFENAQNANVEEGSVTTMCEVLDRVENRGISIGAEREVRRIIINMHDSGFPDDQIATATGKSVTVVQTVIADTHPVMA